MGLGAGASRATMGAMVNQKDQEWGEQGAAGRARRALAPLALLLCACRLMGAGRGDGGLRSLGAGQGARGNEMWEGDWRGPLAIRADASHGPCLPEIWAGFEPKGSSPEALSLGTVLGDPSTDEWPAEFLAIARRACEACDGMGEAACDAALKAAGARFKGKPRRGREVAALDLGQAMLWLSEGALDAASLAKACAEFRAMGGKPPAKEFAMAEAAALAMAANPAKPVGAVPAKGRL